jgi:hypothetical protein
VILPLQPAWDTEHFQRKFNANPVPNGFHYNSGDNSEFLTVGDLRKEIGDHLG